MPKRIPDAELLDGIRDLADELGEAPTKEQMNDMGDYGKNTYDNHFGSWTDAVREAGHTPQRDYNVAREDLLKELQRLRRLIGDTPRQQDMNELGSYSAQMYRRRFDSWNNALEEVGFSPNRRDGIPDSELVEYLKTFREQLGRVPRIKDMTQHGDFAVNNYARRYGSWNQALEEAGMSPNKEFHGQHGDGLYGEFWKKRRRKALERDGRKCQSCGMGNEKHIQDYGMSLEVHHIKPARKFDDPSKRHSLENLVTLCRDCHNRWEGIELRPQLVHADS